jgi:hypothetical protein
MFSKSDCIEYWTIPAELVKMAKINVMFLFSVGRNFFNIQVQLTYSVNQKQNMSSHTGTLVGCTKQQLPTIATSYYILIFHSCLHSE